MSEVKKRTINEILLISDELSQVKDKISFNAIANKTTVKHKYFFIKILNLCIVYSFNKVFIEFNQYVNVYYA